MLAEDNGAFRPVDVEIGIESGGQTEIKRGLQAGQRVVVSGQFLIDSEASLKGVEARLDRIDGSSAKADRRRSSAHGRRQGREHRCRRRHAVARPDPVAAVGLTMTMDFKLPASGPAPRRRSRATACEFALSTRQGNDFVLDSIEQARRGAEQNDRALIRWSIANRFLVLLATAARHRVGRLRRCCARRSMRCPTCPTCRSSSARRIPGQAPQIVENQVTYPLTTTMLSVPGAKTVRGYSFFGDSFVYVLFEDGTDLYWARSRVLEYLNQVQSRLPAQAKPALGPDATGVGWIYRYALVDRTRPPRSRRSCARCRTGSSSTS